MNAAIIAGNVGKDPVLRHTTGGSAVVSFSVATSERSGDKTYTTWHDCVAWKGLAEAIHQGLRKGDPVIIIGSTSKRSYEKDGRKVYITEILVKNIGVEVRPQKREGATNGGNMPDRFGA